MKKRLGLLLFSLFLIGAVLLGRTAGFRSQQLQVVEARPSPFISREAAKHLAAAIDLPTVSHRERLPGDSLNFQKLHQLFKTIYPRVSEELRSEIVGGESLLYTWEGQDKTLPPVLLTAHLDVVPADEGISAGSSAAKKWAYPPFSGAVEEGFIWGRGALDDKGSVIAILEAVEALLQEGFRPRRTLYIAFGADEEVGGERGAASIATLLQARGVVPELVLDEGSALLQGFLPGFSRPLALVGIAEKGYLTVTLTAHAPGGHSSFPPRELAIDLLSEALRRLKRHPMPLHLTLPVREMLRYLGPEESFPLRLVFANLFFFRPLVERALAREPASEALVRTTAVPTMLRGGIKENVLPEEAQAVVNIRLLPGDSIKEVLAHLRRVVGKEIAISADLEHANPPSAVSPLGLPFIQLQRAIQSVFPTAIVAPTLVVAGTDSRHYEPIAQNIYRFTPVLLTPSDLARVHGVNERLSLAALDQMILFYSQLCKIALQ